MAYIWSLVPGLALFSGFYLSNSGEMNLVLRDFWRVSFFYIALALMVTPIISLSKRNSLAVYRRKFGVLAGVFALLHAIKFFLVEYTYHGVLLRLEDAMQWDVASGIIAMIIIAILWATSNDQSIRFFRAGWKKIQSLTYPLFLLVALHVAFASRFEGFYVAIISLVVALRLAAYITKKPLSTRAKNIQSTRYLCVPCWYVYDEAVGDVDGGIAPGTRFEDIPDDWVCPVCGVGKSDFIPLPDEEAVNSVAKVITAEFLNPTTLELVIEVASDAKILPGQYARIGLEDTEWKFFRSYSVVSQDGRLIRFCIKLTGGRGGKVLSNIRAGDTVGFDGIYGKFTLKNSEHPKVFIATGTGLAPIVFMAKSIPGIAKTLFFSVGTKEELFYEEELSGIPLLESRIFLSKESVDGYQFGRINLSKEAFSPETEFYLCGNPQMIEDTRKFLESRGFVKIFFEKF